MLAFVHTYSQTRARLMFVTTLEMDNFDCTKMNAPFQKFTACLREGLIHKWKQALLAPPLPLMSLNNSRLCSTHKHSSTSSSTSTNDILQILVKAQPSTQSTGPRSPTRLGIRSQDLGLPNEYSLGHLIINGLLDANADRKRGKCPILQTVNGLRLPNELCAKILQRQRILSAWIPGLLTLKIQLGERATLTHVRLKRAWMYSTTRRLSQTQHQLSSINVHGCTSLPERSMSRLRSGNDTI